MEQTLDCGHPPTPDSGPGTGMVVTPNSYKMCYDCSDTWQRSALANLPVNGRSHGYLRLGSPYGSKTFDEPGRVGEVTTWHGGHLGWVVPGSLRMAQMTAFNNGDYRRIFGRFILVVTENGGTEVERLFRFYGGGDGMVATIIRMRDRKNPLSRTPGRGQGKG